MNERLTVTTAHKQNPESKMAIIDALKTAPAQLGSEYGGHKSLSGHCVQNEVCEVMLSSIYCNISSWNDMIKRVESSAKSQEAKFWFYHPHPPTLGTKVTPMPRARPQPRMKRSRRLKGPAHIRI